LAVHHILLVFSFSDGAVRFDDLGEAVYVVVVELADGALALIDVPAISID